jgi:Fe-S cluster assembly protein SufB
MPATSTELLEQYAQKEGFVTDIEQDTVPPGLDEDVVRLISAKKASRSGCSSGASRPTATG